jgi:ATP-dependent Clp protease ATP-binding subunit ClpC
MFDQLSKESIFKIIDLELKGLYKRIAELGYQVTITDAAKEFLAEKGYDVQFGARPLKRAIQKYIEDEMAEMILRTSLKEGETLVIDFDNESKQITMKVANQIEQPSKNEA